MKNDSAPSTQEPPRFVFPPLVIGDQKVYRADHPNPKFWGNGFTRLRLLRRSPF